MASRPHAAQPLLSWLPAGMLAAVLACIAPCPAAAAALGVYVGDDPGDVASFEAWLGCPVQQVLIFTDERSWRHIADPRWFVDRFATLDRPALWSVAMIPKGATLQGAATGAHDADYVAEARVLARARPDAHGVIRVRLGWELNGDWFPWAAEGRQQAFIATYRHLVDAFRSVSDRFRFEWNINYGQKMDPATAYPGDRYVDVIGMDFYWKPQYQGNDPVRAFAKIRDDRYGLGYIQKFAAEHHKPVAFSEWGAQGPDARPFIELVSQWIKAHGILYHDYWDSDDDYPGRLSGGRWPDSGAAFRHAFCPRN